MGTGGEEFNNLLDTAYHVNPSKIDFAAHAASMGAESVHVGSIDELEDALIKAKDAAGPFVAVIDTDPYPSTPYGGSWWQVAVPEVSEREAVREARKSYEAGLAERNKG